MNSGDFVYVVICIDKDGEEDRHIFSSLERAEQYMATDQERVHVVYDYMVDCPERTVSAPQ